jgi:hypothetical protein
MQMSYDRNYALNAICPYFTMFPLEYPSRVLRKHVHDNPVVLDPFCGRGTTLYSARTMNLKAWGIDSSPVAVAIAKAKLAACDIEAPLALAKRLIENNSAVAVPQTRFFRAAYHPRVLREICSIRTGLLGMKIETDAAVILRAATVPRLITLYEPNVDETAAGRFAANILGAMNQLSSDALSERMKDRTRASIRAGRFPWRAPIGYENIGGKTGPNITPDEKRAPLIRRAFELMMTGLHSKAEVLRIITNEGLTTASGKALSKQTLQAAMRNPLYAGWVTLPSDPSFEPARGLHEPIVDQETFDHVQKILDGRRPNVVAKQKINPVVPLQHFVKCGSCGVPALLVSQCRLSLSQHIQSRARD